MTETLVTIVVSPREGHFMAEASLASVLADESLPFEMIYLDIASPPAVREAIAAQGAARGFKVVRHDAFIAPSLARRAVLGEIKTPYVAFVDNDVLVEPGCLRTLVYSAIETGAGLASPLYLEGGRGTPSRIHMAGGAFEWTEDHQLAGAQHVMAGEPPEAAAGLERRLVDFTEYHYVVGRTDFLAAPGVVADDVLLAHEHMDLALAARQRGVDVLLDPAAKITYVAHEPRALADIDFYRRRWGAEACAESAMAFRRRWLGDGPWAIVEMTTRYARSRLQEMDLRRPDAVLGAGPDAGDDLAAAMTAAELAQSRLGLREQALARGYDADERAQIEAAADMALWLYDGLYRPDGRPFLCHAIGTASVMVRYGLGVELVQAGLLHAVFTHKPAWIEAAELGQRLDAMANVGRLVTSQPAAREFLAAAEGDVMGLNMTGARTLALLAANEADMRLSGEYRASGRGAEIGEAGLARIDQAMAIFGVEGLAASARAPAGDVAAAPLMGQGWRASFRLDAPGRRMTAV